MNTQQIIMIEALLNTFNEKSTSEEKRVAQELCSILGDETGDVLNDLKERIYAQHRNLQDYLDCRYPTCSAEINEYILLSMSNGLTDFDTPEEVMVLDESVDDWATNFEAWFKSRNKTLTFHFSVPGRICSGDLEKALHDLILDHGARSLNDPAIQAVTDIQGDLKD